MYKPKIVRVLLASALAIAVACGQSQVATVSSSSPFTLRGANVNPGQGVPDWPVLTGDTIIAGHSPVTVVFPDGSSITLNPGAEATVGLSGQTPVFRLLKGSAHYSLKTLMSVQLMSEGESVAVKSLTGALGKASGALAGVGHAAGTLASVVGAHTVASIATAGVVAGLGVGITQATNGGTSVSPSH